MLFISIVTFLSVLRRILLPETRQLNVINFISRDVRKETTEKLFITYINQGSFFSLFVFFFFLLSDVNCSVA
jgi:hypothetical protein